MPRKKKKPAYAMYERGSPLSVAQILNWAEAHHARRGRWPTQRSGTIVRGLTWASVNRALRLGRRGLPGGSSLAVLLAEKRGPRRAHSPRRLTVKQILAWADLFHAQRGRWPTQRSGTIEQAAGLTWASVNGALRRGGLGLGGGSSLRQLLASMRGVWAGGSRRLTVEQILSWADAFHAHRGRWPTRRSGMVEHVSGLTWELIHTALRHGRHGLAGGSSLAALLRRERGTRKLPPLDVARILTWADAYHARRGAWPAGDSGPIDGVPGETWFKVDAALAFGLRGLPDGGSLAALLAERRGAAAGGYVERQGDHQPLRP